MESTKRSGPVRFGVFELDLRAGELRRQGVKVKLQEQPFQILLLLLERAGEVVTKEELRERLWADDTFVEFEHSLSTAIGKIRDALGDSAGSPRFIETVARRGYRFLAPLLRAEEQSSWQSGLGSPNGTAMAPGVEPKLDLLQQLSPVEAGEISPDSATRRATKTAQVTVNRKLVGWISTVLFLLGIVALVGVIHSRRSSTDAGVIRLSLVLPEEATFQERGGPLLSPDGRRVAFAAANASGKSLLWIRSLDDATAQSLPGTDGASHPFWSPDSRWIGFSGDGKLKKIEVFQGPPQTVCDRAPDSGGTWNREGVIVFSTNLALYRVSAQGGKPEPLTLDQSSQELAHQWPHFLPDGRHFLYVVTRTQPDNLGLFGIRLGSLNSKETKSLLSADSSAVYALPGYLLFMRHGLLRAQPFDAERLLLAGDVFTVARKVACDPKNIQGSFSVSEKGVLAYWTGGDKQVAWVDRAGKRLGVPGPPDFYDWTPQLSPDEKSAALTRTDLKIGPSDIWLVDLARGIPSRFTFDPALDTAPTWSPDGSRIVFASLREGSWNLFQKAASGAGKEATLLKSSDNKFPSNWSLDGRFIAYMSLTRTGMDLWVLPLFGDLKPRAFLQTEFNERNGQFSPDVHWMAYDSDESGKTEVYVRTFPGSDDKRQVSSNGGSDPKWSRDGKELFYIAPDSNLMAVPVNRGTDFNLGTPKALFQTHLAKPYLCGEYAVARDGQRFLMPMGKATSVPFTVVINWTGGLKE